MIPRRPGPTASVMLALLHRWEPESVVVIYSTYIDVSGGHDGSPIMVMGGYIARLGQWCNLDKKFGLLLKRNGLTYHHTKKLFHGEGEYDGWSLPKKTKYINKVGSIIDKNTLCGFSIAMKHEDYSNHYANDPRPPKVRLDGRYGLCFRIFLSHLPQLINRSCENVEMHLFLEDGDRGIGESCEIFQAFKKFAPRELAEIVKSRTIAEKKDYYGLQIADWAAYAAYLAEQKNPDLTPYPPKGTIAEAAELLSYNSPVFRLEATPQILKEMRDAQVSDRQDRRTYWMANKSISPPSSVV